MDEERKGSALHLPSLSISRFRGIDSLSIGRLGRVTLLAGRNSVGKTTVLDAVRLYAARAHRAVLSEILESNGEVSPLEHPEGGQGFGPCWEAIFNGRDASRGASLSIGPSESPDQLVIGVTHQKSASLAVKSWDLPTRTLKVVIEGLEVAEVDFCPYSLSTRITRSRAVFQSEWFQKKPPDEVTCQSMGPELWTSDEIMERWDAIALTDEEDRVVSALQPILGDQPIRISIIGDQKHHRRVMAKLGDQPFPVPLKSLGDGALRLLGVALALANSRDGFLLIDEAENGIHHSVQRDYWRMVLLAAHASNVQVIATTHSFDCVRGFAQAVGECEGIEGALVRLERQDGHLRAVEYSERNLRAAAEGHIEVR